MTTAADPDALTRLIGAPPSPELDDAVARRLSEKAHRIETMLGRPVDVTHPSPRASGYRARLSLRPDRDGALGQSLPGTHAHVPLRSVPLARAELNRVLPQLPPMPGFGQVELRSDGERVVLSAWSPRKGRGARNRRNRGATPALRDAIRSLDLAGSGLAGAALDGRAIAGAATTALHVAGIDHVLSPDTFFQVNLEVNAALVAAVGRLARELEPSALLDLYAGAGNLSLPLAADGVPTVLVESGRSSTADAQRTIARRKLPAEVRTDDAGRFSAGDAFFDVAILDPPRAGAPGVLPQLALTRPRGILYVSCNPSALVRDLRPLSASGYQVDRVEVFDMFPQTPHAEVLVRLVRQP